MKKAILILLITLAITSSYSQIMYYWYTGIYTSDNLYADCIKKNKILEIYQYEDWRKGWNDTGLYTKLCSVKEFNAEGLLIKIKGYHFSKLDYVDSLMYCGGKLEKEIRIFYARSEGKIVAKFYSLPNYFQENFTEYVDGEFSQRIVVDTLPNIDTGWYAKDTIVWLYYNKDDSLIKRSTGTIRFKSKHFTLNQKILARDYYDLIGANVQLKMDKWSTTLTEQVGKNIQRKTFLVFDDNKAAISVESADYYYKNKRLIKIINELGAQIHFYYDSKTKLLQKVEMTDDKGVVERIRYKYNVSLNCP